MVEGGVKGGKGIESRGEDKEPRVDDATPPPAFDDRVVVESFGSGDPPDLHLVKTWFTICVRPPWATVWLIGSLLRRKTLYTVRTALSRDD